MAYEAPTIDEFKARFAPVFDAVQDAQITAAIARGLRNVDATWAVDDYAEGVMLYAAYWLTAQGIGASADASNASGSMSGFSEIRSGQLTLKRKTNAEIGGNDGSLMASNIYGRLYLDLMRLNKRGPAVAAGPNDVDGPWYDVPYNGGFGS